MRVRSKYNIGSGLLRMHYIINIHIFCYRAITSSLLCTTRHERKPKHSLEQEKNTINYNLHANSNELACLDSFQKEQKTQQTYVFPPVQDKKRAKKQRLSALLKIPRWEAKQVYALQFPHGKLFKRNCRGVSKRRFIALWTGNKTQRREKETIYEDFWGSGRRNWISVQRAEGFLWGETTNTAVMFTGTSDAVRDALESSSGQIREVMGSNLFNIQLFSSEISLWVCLDKTHHSI